MQESYCLQMTTVLGLRPDASIFKLEINYCFLQARFFILCCRVKGPLKYLVAKLRGCYASAI